MKNSRVLVLSAHTGEMDRRIIAEANSLAESGRAVTLVSVPTKVPENCLQPGVQLILPPYPVGGPKKRARGWLADLAYRSAKKVFHLFRPLVRARRFRALQREFIDSTPAAAYDAIHCHDLDTLPAAQAVRERLAPRAKLIYDAHELYPYQVTDPAFQSYWAWVEMKCIHHPDLVITVNESIADQFANIYGIRRPAVIFNSYGSHGNQVPLSREAFFRHFGVPPGGFCVLFQGSLTPLRNLPNLVRAFASLDDSYRLFILGSGPLEQELRQLCQQAHIGNVAFGGHIPQADLLRFTAHADMGIIPYEDAGLLNMRYCSPNKLFEFIEAKVPICASQLPELTRLVTDNGIGATYRMQSAAAVASAIRDCRQRCERGEFATAQRESARRRFAWSEQSKRLIALYDSLGV